MVTLTRQVCHATPIRHRIAAGTPVTGPQADRTADRPRTAPQVDTSRAKPWPGGATMHEQPLRSTLSLLPHAPACSTSTAVTAGQGAINSQFVRLTASQSRPERRSNDGQAILEPVQIAWKCTLTWYYEWSYGDSNPRPLACHPVATRPPECVAAGHRPESAPRSACVQAGCGTFVLYDPTPLPP